MAKRTAKLLPGLQKPAVVEKVIFCSGKIFYHLYHRRSALKLENVTFVRLEQVAPFPLQLMARAIRRYPQAGEQMMYQMSHHVISANPDIMLLHVALLARLSDARAVELVWAQEEPQNMGAWSYVKPRFDTVLREKKFPQQTIRWAG